MVGCSLEVYWWPLSTENEKYQKFRFLGVWGRFIIFGHFGSQMHFWPHLSLKKYPGDDHGLLRIILKLYQIFVRVLNCKKCDFC